MRFIIYSNGEIPGFGGIRGPVLTPQSYEPEVILKWVSAGLDIREVMEDGTYRKVTFNDGRIKMMADKGYEVVKSNNPEVKNIDEVEPIVEEEVVVEIPVLVEEKTYPPQEVEEVEEEEIEDSFEIDELEELD